MAIARAIAIKPEFVICDESTSSLDVSIQAQILNLLKDLQAEHQLTYLYISHDLFTVRYISNKVGVMYCGKLLELTSTNLFFTHPLHPYSKLLLTLVDIIGVEQGSKVDIDKKDILGDRNTINTGYQT